MSANDDRTGSHPAPATLTAKLLGLELPLPTWTLFPLGLLVIAGVFGVLYRTVALPMIDRRAAELHNELDMLEYSRHYNEVKQFSTTIVDSPSVGQLGVAFLASDGCLEVKVRPPGSLLEQSHFIKRMAYTGPAPGPLVNPNTVTSAPRNGSGEAALAGDLVASSAIVAMSGRPPEALGSQPPTETQACGGRCLGIHPGQFQTWNAGQNGCFVAVWRKWPDGCTHYQWYNTCNGGWDSNPDGSPHVYWTCCVH
jgi:hypothetical protein